MDAVSYMNRFSRWKNPPPPSTEWELALARACDELEQRDEREAQLLAACKAALADYETINAAARVAGLHPFTIGPAQLTAAIAAAESEAT